MSPVKNAVKSQDRSAKMFKDKTASRYYIKILIFLKDVLTLFSRFPERSVIRFLGRSVDKYQGPSLQQRVLRSVVQLLVQCVVQYLETSVETSNNRFQLSSQNKSATQNPSR